MRKYVKTLVSSTTNLRCGNHAVKFAPKSTTFLDDRKGEEVEIKNPSKFYPLRVFTYHGNTICIVSDSVNEFWLSHAGWWTSSTTQALNQYREYFTNWGYHCMTDD